MINMASPIQFCMESSSTDWLKAIIPDEGAAIDNSSPSQSLCPLLRPSGVGPALERRLRPPPDQLALKCPRCESTHTKFCYYNNYSLSQPRYFCKTCRRYWTKGGSLRNVPVGGGCRRKNKRPAPPSKKPNITAADQIQSIMHQHHHHHQTDLQLSNLNFMFDSHFASGFGIGLGDDNAGADPLGAYSINEACQRLGMPFGGEEEEEANVGVDVKPGNRMLSLEWPDQGCAGDAFGYSNGSLGLWAGMINGHGPSSAAM